MSISKLDKTQIIKVLKALAYAFASGFTATLILTSGDFITAAVQGKAQITNLVLALVGGAIVGGINAVFVFIKQLFTPVKG